jgi:hypothetical protein
MSKYIRLTENELVKIVKKVIREQDETKFEEPEPEIWAMAMNNAKKSSDNAGLAEDFDESEDYEETDD